MRSIADDFRRESRQAVGALEPFQRVSLALALGDADVALYRSAHDVTETEARAAFARARANGRAASRANDRCPS